MKFRGESGTVLLWIIKLSPQFGLLGKYLSFPRAVRQLQRQFHGEGSYNHQRMLGARIRASFIWTEENSFVFYNSQRSH